MKKYYNAVSVAVVQFTDDAIRTSIEGDNFISDWNTFVLNG